MVGPGLAIKVPSGWSDDTESAFSGSQFNSGTSAVLHASNAADNTQLSIVHETLSHLSSTVGGGNPPNLAQIAAVVIPGSAQTFNCNAPASFTRTTIDQTPALYADMDCTGTTIRIYVAVRGRFAYYVTFASDTSAFSAQLSSLAAILSSWLWLDSTAGPG